MNDLPESMLEQMQGALRGPWTRHEALLLIGQLLAWHSLAQRGSLPEGLSPPQGDEALTPTVLDNAFNALAGLKSLEALALAFSGQRETYARIAPDELTALTRVCQALVMLDIHERRVLADAWAIAISAETPREFMNIPLEVADLVVRSLGLREGQAVHCPGAAMDMVAIAAMRYGLAPIVESLTPPTVAAIYAAMTAFKMRFQHADPLRPDPDVTSFLAGVEACVALPPWGERLDPLARLAKRPSRFGARSSEALGLEMVLTGHARESAVLVPNGLLGGRGPDSELRRCLVDSGPLQAVIGFPPNLLAGTSMPFSVLRLSKASGSEPVVFCKVDEQQHLTGQGRVRSRDRRFVGAEAILKLLEYPEPPLARAVSREEILAQDFTLAPERYLSAAAPLLADLWKETAPLGDLVTIVKPQFLRPDEDPAGEPIQEAIPSDVPKYGYLESVERVRTVDRKLLAARRQQVLEDNDVLLSTKGTIGRVGIARPDRSRPPLLPSQASVILRLRPSAALDPRFLVMYLRSPLVQQAIASLAVGGTIPNISLADLRALPVWLASREEQAPSIEAFERQAALQAQIAGHQKEQTSVAQQAWRQARLLGVE